MMMGGPSPLNDPGRQAEEAQRASRERPQATWGLFAVVVGFFLVVAVIGIIVQAI